MPEKASEGDFKRSTLAVLATIALVAGAGAYYMRAAAGKASRAADAAFERLAQEKDLALRYRKLSPEKIHVSADVKEARSSEFIGKTLRSTGIGSGGVDYGDPEEITGNYQRVETEIKVEKATFASVLNFLREVETNGPQLTLQEADIRRAEDSTADMWRVSLTYVALIPAKPHS